MRKPSDKAFEVLPKGAAAVIRRWAIAAALIGVFGPLSAFAEDVAAPKPATEAVSMTKVPSGATGAGPSAGPSKAADAPAAKTGTAAPNAASTPVAGTAAASNATAPAAAPNLNSAASEPSHAVETLAGAVPAVPTKLHRDLTPIGMFLSADPIVQGVMIILAGASVVTWTILVVKVIELFLAKRRMRRTLAALRASSSLEDATGTVRGGLAGRLILEAVEELEASHGLPSGGVKERALIGLQRIEVTAAKRMAVGTGILATIGSIGPFVGLFGTVWGIMRSFIGIANSNTTNLAVVAPGIAEALLATGIGLVAAIPAVVIYNVLTRSIGGYRTMIGDAGALMMRHLSRDLDRREYGGGRQRNPRLAAE